MGGGRKRFCKKDIICEESGKKGHPTDRCYNRIGRPEERKRLGRQQYSRDRTRVLGFRTPDPGRVQDRIQDLRLKI